MTYPRIYTFLVHGGSPGGGLMLVLAMNGEQALEAAQEKISEMNDERDYINGPYILEDRGHSVSTSEVPQVIYCDDGER